MREKITLDEGVVKYIFPGVHPKVALGEDGYIVYDFDKTYPQRLAVFVPIEVAPSNYSNVFPKSFEDYFRDLDLEISRLSLLLELGNVFRRFPKTEFIPGQIIKHDDSEYTVFRFDELLKSEQVEDLLCRTKMNELSVPDTSEIYAISEGFRPDKVYTVDGEMYLYWNIPVKKLFRFNDEEFMSYIPMIQISLNR